PRSGLRVASRGRCCRNPRRARSARESVCHFVPPSNPPGNGARSGSRAGTTPPVKPGQVYWIGAGGEGGGGEVLGVLRRLCTRCIMFLLHNLGKPPPMELP